MFIPKVTTASELKEIDFLEAQEWCNFVLFAPIQLSNRMVIINKQLRTESVNGFSSYRFLISDGSRTLSIKQFLYDWAPPAYDHPSLWRNAKISKVSETPIPKPFLVGHDVAWIGLNFRRQRAASLNLKRTMIEMTVIEGVFDDEELIEIYKSLQPMSKESEKNILSTPFACLCKSYRHKEKASSVPLSYWKYTRNDTCFLHPVLPTSTSVLPIKLPENCGYHLNSIFIVENPLCETEYYYEKEDLSGSYIRLLVTSGSSKQTIACPPKLGDQVCKSQNLNTNGIDIYHAYLNEQFGPHEAIWQYKDKTMLLLIKPASWTTLKWFHQFISNLLSSQGQIL